MTIPNRSEELEQFKTQIDFREYLLSRGYTHDSKKSSSRYYVMRHTNGEKLILTRKANRHWLYFNPHDALDQGTLIDFVQTRGRFSLGEVRKELRPWLGSTKPIGDRTYPDFTPTILTQPNFGTAQTTWENASLINGLHDYLERERQIPREILTDPLFDRRIRHDPRYGNALFAHYNSNGLCGYEIKNRGFTGFSTGGTKGLFCSRPRPDDNELWVCETAIDTLSAAALFGTEQKRFVSTAGQISPAQRALLQSAAQKMPYGSKIILAMDNDSGGKKLVATIKEALKEIDLTGKSILPYLPEHEGDDWNDVLSRNAAERDKTPTPA